MTGRSNGSGDPGPDGAPENADREEFVHAPVGGMAVSGGMTVGELLAEYGNAGIGAADLHRAGDVLAEMLGDREVSVFMGLAGAMVPAGMRRVVADLLRDGHVDALVTTGATLTHDAIEAVGGRHHHGRTGPDRPHPAREEAPPAESGEPPDERPSEERDGRPHDERLREEGVDRIYNVYLPQEHFALFEAHLRESVFPELERTVPVRELTRRLGEANAERNRAEGVDADPGIAAAAAAADVPVYVPAVQDSVLGIQAWLYGRTSEFGLDPLDDMTHVSDLAHAAERAGAFVVGGGVPKNYVLQTMLTVPGAYDHGVQLTTDPEATGGLSGASLQEARSWGKLEPTARNVTVLGDATITLPLLVAGVRERVETDGD